MFWFPYLSPVSLMFRIFLSKQRDSGCSLHCNTCPHRSRRSHISRFVLRADGCAGQLIGFQQQSCLIIGVSVSFKIIESSQPGSWTLPVLVDLRSEPFGPPPPWLHRHTCVSEELLLCCRCARLLLSYDNGSQSIFRRSLGVTQKAGGTQR